MSLLNYTKEQLAFQIKETEKKYADTVYQAAEKDIDRIREWYEHANLVKETWVGKMGIDPRNEVSSWGQVGEQVLVGWLHKTFLQWEPAGLSIGSETRLITPDTVLHFDVKTHREGDSDLDRTQDVRPEQISGNGDYQGLFSLGLPRENDFIKDAEGDLGEMPPKLPPYYRFGNDPLKLCVTLFAICVYQPNLETNDQILTRVQLVCMPNGILRALEDYSDIFQVGKNGRAKHRFRVNLKKLKGHDSWRFREIRASASALPKT